MPTDLSSETSPKPAATYIGLREGRPFLKGARCELCAATYLGERVTCGRCGARDRMQAVELGSRGRLYNYTIVHRSYPGVKVPFISAIVDLDGGGTVKGNLLDVEPSVEAIQFDMPVEVVFRDAGQATSEGAGFTAHFFIPSQG